ncbi:MAG: GntR family transcriptional regulator [Burkholderiaceae bacterium]|nr:GntR family transcriptional regulator [Burkholderiaceae bacterium]
MQTSVLEPRPREQAGPDDRAAMVMRIRQRFIAVAEGGLPKHAQLRKAILGCVNSGLLVSGSQLPPEQVLTASLGLSLGTVRRAIEQLAAARVLVREHGRGTYVASTPRAISDNWHFRFFAEGGSELLPVYSRVIERKLLRGHGPWTEALGRDAKGFVLIRRQFNIDDRFYCHSEFYLPATRFGAMMKRPIGSIEAINLKSILAEQFAAPTLYVKQRARVARMPDAVCDQIEVARQTMGLFLQLVGYTFSDTAFSYHEVWIPPMLEMLELAQMWPVGPQEQQA